MRYCQQVSRKEINLKPVVLDLYKGKEVIEITMPDEVTRVRLRELLKSKGILTCLKSKKWYFKFIENVPKYKQA